MRKQTILSIAIISILPLTINGASGTTLIETNTPTTVGKYDNANFAKSSPPYVIAEITNDDATHIASTAYVKGAYNDTIAGINKVHKSLANGIAVKQNNLYYMYNDTPMFFRDEVETDLSDVTTDYQLVTGLAVKNAIDGVNNEIDTVNNNLTNVNNRINNVNSALSDKRVEIYTTWDDDTATQQVQLANYKKPKD